MKVLEDFALGEAGFRQLQADLKGLGGLSSAILPKVQAGQGRVFSPLPRGTSLTDAIAFQRDGVAPYDATHQWLVNQALTFCQAHPDSTVIFETNWKGEFGDPLVMDDPRPKFFYRNLPYYYVEGRLIEEEAVWQAINGANGLGLAGAFVHYPLTTEEIPADLVVGDALIHTLADKVEWVFVAAYDAGGFVVWQR